MVNDSFCVLPFFHSCTNVGGRNKPCCRFSDKEYTDNIPAKEYFNGSKLAELRSKMLNGEYIKGCEKCYQEESLGKTSYRNSMNEMFKKYDYKNPQMLYIEIGLSNSCNFACVTCDAAYSTSWWKDIDKVNEIGANKAKPKKQVIYSAWDFSKEELSGVKRVKLLGGEPFMEPKNIDFLNSLPVENITLDLVTNCSIKPNNKWLEIFKKVKQLHVSISLDGEGKTAEFVRYGTNWKKVAENIKWWKQLQQSAKNETEIIFHFVVHNLNIHNINDYLKFSKDIFPTTFDILQKPEYLNIRILPKKQKKDFIKMLDNKYIIGYLKNNLEYQDEKMLSILSSYKQTLENIR